MLIFAVVGDGAVVILMPAAIEKQCFIVIVMRGSRGGRDRGSGPPLKNHKNIGFLSNTALDSLLNKRAYNVGPTFARQRNAISMAFRWQANDGLLLVEFCSSPLTN